MRNFDHQVLSLPPLPELKEAGEPSSDGRFDYYGTDVSRWPVTFRAVLESLIVFENPRDLSVKLKCIVELEPDEYAKVVIKAAYTPLGQLTSAKVTRCRKIIHVRKYLRRIFADTMDLVAIGA